MWYLSAHVGVAALIADAISSEPSRLPPDDVTTERCPVCD